MRYEFVHLNMFEVFFSQVPISGVNANYILLNAFNDAIVSASKIISVNWIVTGQGHSTGDV